MFKKTMTFDDLDGNEVNQTFYFNYNKKEIGELLEFGELSQFPSDHRRLPLEKQMELLQTPVEKSGLTEQENAKQAYRIFQDLILDAYGEKGTDNVTFVKNERTREYFKSHVAFVELVFEFLANPEQAGKFFEQCLPAKLVAQAKQELPVAPVSETAEKTAPTPTPSGKTRQEDLSEEEIRTMDIEDFQKLDPRRLSPAQMMVAFQRKAASEPEQD